MLDADVEKKALQGLEVAATKSLRRRTLTRDGHLLNAILFFDFALNPFSGAALSSASDEGRILMITQVDLWS